MLTSEIVKQLNEKQVLLLTYLFNECVNNHFYTKSNKDLEKATGIPESSIEKYLKLFDDLKYIIRSSEREVDPVTGQWRTKSRSIELNPKVFDPRMIAVERDVRINSLLDIIDSNEYQTRQIGRKLSTR